MIVTCERCKTRFELEDEKIPPAGARVRCSKCRFSFFVKPAATGEGETQVVASGAPAPRGKAAKPAAAAPAEDATRVLPAPAASAGRAEGGDEESDWQFNEEPARKPAGARRAPVSPLREFLAPAREEAPSLEQLGDPESWDLVGNDEGGEVAVPRVRPEASAAARPGPPASPTPAPAQPIAAAAPAPPRRALVEEPEEAPTAGAQPLAWGLHAAGWAATLVLVALVARASLAPRAPGGVPAPPPLRSGTFDLRDLSARRLENAFGQRLLVVSGRLANEGDQELAPATGLRVTLLADDGSALPGVEARGATAPGEDRLREQPSEALLGDAGWRASILAWTPIAAHGSSEFAAVVFDPPAAASRVQLELTPPPPQPPQPAHPAVAPAPPPEATVPSVPSPPPSSG